MATLADLFNKKKKPDGSFATTSEGGGGAGTNSTANAPATAPAGGPGSGSFTNMQTTLDANEKSREQLANRVQGGIGQKAQNVKQQAQQAATDVSNIADESKRTTASYVENARALQQNAASAKAEDINQLNANVNQMSAPAMATDVRGLTNEYNTLQRQAQNLGTQSGRIQNLRSLFGNASQGALGLDEQMLSGQDFSGARKQVLGAGLGVNEAAKQVAQTEGAIAQQQEGVRQASKEAGNAILGSLQGAGQTQRNELTGLTDQFQAFLAGDQSKKLTAEQLQKLGVNLDQSVGFTGLDELGKGIDRNALDASTYENFLNDDQFQSLQAAQNLTGGGVSDSGIARSPLDLFNDANIQNKTTKDIAGLGQNLSEQQYRELQTNKLNQDAQNIVNQNNEAYGKNGAGATYVYKDANNQSQNVSDRGLIALARENPEQLRSMENYYKGLIDRKVNPNTGRLLTVQETNAYKDILKKTNDARNASNSEFDARARVGSQVEAGAAENYAAQNRKLRELLGV